MSTVSTVAEALNVAVQYHRAGQLAQAEQIYRQILSVDPQHADAIQLLGVIANQVGKAELAIQYIQAAIGINPNSAMYYNNLGEAYRAMNRAEEAKACYRRALEMQPGYGDALNNLGVVVQGQGNLEEAEALYRQCLAQNPQQVEALSNLGTVLQALARNGEAIQVYSLALQLNPNHAPTHNNLGRIYTDQGNYLAAEQCIARAVELKPDMALAYENLAIVRRAQGKYQEARTAFEKAMELAPHDGIKIQHAILTPIVLESHEHIRETRQRVIEGIRWLETQPLVVSDPLERIGVNLFYMPYHGLNDRDIQRDIANIFARATPSLVQTAPHCLAGHPHPEREKIHIGFISKYFFQHSVGRHNMGIIRNIDKSKFHVTVFYFPGTEDDMTEAVRQAASEVVKLSPQLNQARQRIMESQLDALIYTDIGMDPWTYFLAYSRLAPVQCVFPGHPETTGIPTVDFYISCDDMEPADAQDHYTETLVRMKHLPTCFYHPKLPEPRKTRREFLLPEDEHLYTVGQMLFKLHPDFDAVMGEILRGDPQGRIVLFEGYQKHWTDTLMARLRRTIPDVLNRVQVYPWLSVEDYIQLLSVADVALDTFHFGGGTTSMQALSVNLPIVTLPGAFMRSRVTYALYKQMGLLDAVANDPQDYVKKALWLGTDRAANEAFRQRIITQREVLYDNGGFVRELEQLLTDKVSQARVKLAGAGANP